MKSQNHFISHSSNGKVEGYNVAIKLLKRVSFGIRDAELYAKKDNAGVDAHKTSTTVFGIDPI
ncbi:hypothetical protein CEE34_07170 [Candidatus Aerophobetes bacterium Ae_b3a]|nr:MAG: hypothetical protein CEE34_07170 [Candidatus Aerophobetes bacterium Ae_b3a]